VITTAIGAILAAGGAALTVVYVVLAIALSVVGILLTVMVLFQDSKSGGLAGAFGGAGATTYGEQTSRRIVKTTAILGGIFLGGLLLMAVISEIGEPAEDISVVEPISEDGTAAAEPPAGEGTAVEPLAGEGSPAVEPTAGEGTAAEGAAEPAGEDG
jgi:preprotein translocase subunit SecG